MNCRPGDIAVIVHPSLAGKLVEVLHLVASPHTRLPNGTLSLSPNADDWVIKSLGQPFAVKFGPGIEGQNEYAVCNDRWLRPIRGTDAQADTFESRELEAA